MKLFAYVRNIVASFSKDDLKQGIRLLGQSIQKVLDNYIAAELLLIRAVSDTGKRFEADLEKAIKLPPKISAVAYIRQILANMGIILEMLSALADKSYGKDVVVDGITYKRAELLRTIDYMDFVVSYASRILHVLVIAEASTETGDHAPGQERPKPEMRWLADNQKAFFALLVTFSKKPRELITLIENIPDITIGENDDRVLVPTVGLVKLDPLRNNMVPVITSFATSVGIWRAEMQARRYERLKEEHRCIQLRIAQRRGQMDGTNDAQQERIIRTYEGYLNKTAEQIAKMEEKYL